MRIIKLRKCKFCDKPVKKYSKGYYITCGDYACTKPKKTFTTFTRKPHLNYDAYHRKTKLLPPEFRQHYKNSFYARVGLPTTEDGCMEWLGHKNHGGYGQLSVHKKMMASHRLSYLMHNGPIPDGMFVCHKCDNPACLRPDHLWLGTCQDNTNDKVNKNRQARSRGEKSSKAKLKETDVIEILEKIRGGYTDEYIAAAYKVTPITIKRIRRNKTWQCVARY